MTFLDRCIFLPVLAGLADFVVSNPAQGFQTPAQAGAVSGQTFHYVASVSDNTVWEIGLGTYTVLSGIATLSRTVISSSAGGAKVNFNVVPNVAVDAISADFNSLLASITAINKTLPAVLNVQAFGADPTGNRDSSAALLAAFNALPNITSISSSGGGELYFPPGLYQFDSAVTLTLPAGWSTVAIRGAGGASTVLWWPNATDGIIIDMSANAPLSSATVEGIKFINGSVNIGNAITLRNNGTSFSQLQTPSVFRDLMFVGSDNNTQFWASAINIVDVCNVEFDNVLVNGPQGSVGGTGVALQGSLAHSNLSVIYNFINCSFNQTNVGVLYGPWIQGLSVTNCNFTSCNIGIWSPASEPGFLAQLLVTTSQFAPFANGFCIKMDTAIEAVSLIGNLFLTGGTGCVCVQAVGYGRMEIVGNTFLSPFAGTALSLGGTGLDSVATVIIADNTFDNYTIGITVAAGCKAVVIHDNTFRNCSTTISNSSTDTVNRIHDNIGYNPVGASAVASPPSSGGTYTAGPSPETIYLSAGTAVSAVTVGGVSILPAALGANVMATFELGSNESIVITYTGTLTMKKMVH